MRPVKNPKSHSLRQNLGYPGASLRRDARHLLKYFLTRSSIRASVRKLEDMESMYVDSDLLIVANGPSSGNVDHETIQRFSEGSGRIMAMNWAHLNPAVSSINPDFWISADRRPTEESEKAEQLREWLSERPETVLLVPEIRVARYEDLFPKHCVAAFCRLAIRHLRLSHWGEKPIFPKSFISQTGLHALQIALWLGFSRVFIIGFDNTYFREIRVNERNELVNLITHAGEEDREEVGGRGMSNFLRSQSTLFADYMKFAESNVFNLDLHSYTDAFTKMPPDVLFEGQWNSINREKSPGSTAL